MAIFPLGGLGATTFGGLFLGADTSAAYFWYAEATRKVSPHSESGGRSWPAPPHKAIAHPFFGHFSVGGFGRADLRVVIFGRSCARGLFLARRGRSQSLTPFRVRRTKLASPSPQAYRPPVFWPFFRWAVCARRPSGGYFLVRLYPRSIFSTRRTLAKSRPIPSPADEVGQPLPPRL